MSKSKTRTPLQRHKKATTTKRVKPQRKSSKTVATRTARQSEETVLSEGSLKRVLNFPVVAIGASAGGLEAITALLKEIPPTSGLAYIYIQHQDPNHKSLLTTLLGRVTELTVEAASNGQKIKPNHVYVVPNDRMFGIMNGTFVNSLPSTERTRLPIDSLFRSLAEDQGSNAIGVVLSGTGSDGTLGVAAIKEALGITFSQDMSARFDGMPRSAINSGHIDFVLPPEQIAFELVRIGSNPYLRVTSTEASYRALFQNETDLNKLLHLIRSHSGVDFSQYKDSTVMRRIARRMLLSRTSKLAQYITYVASTPTELQILYDDLLINVTSFFRDPESFESLKKQVFPEIVKGRSFDQPIRIWVTGCSTGEEAYSIAIALVEFYGKNIESVNVQIFATDVSDKTIVRARKGIYPESITQDVSPARLRKFFKKTDGGYQVNKRIRDMCIFARQNMAKDPPFSRLDMISCRNVLIYLGPALQKQLIQSFHQGLRPDGFLMLGSSETIGAAADLFQLIDKKNKIYTKKSIYQKTGSPTYSDLPRMEFPHQESRDPGLTREIRTVTDLQKEADRLTLAQHGPPGVIVDADLEIVHFRGDTVPFLRPASGEASLNLIRMASGSLKLDLRTSIVKAKNSGEPFIRKGLELEYDGKTIYFNLEILPIENGKQKGRFYLVLFSETGDPNRQSESTKKQRSVGRGGQNVEKLKEELAHTKEYLQRTIAEQNAYTEELKSANEEIQSSNEELQSTNEELETAKEELQSINEELTTLNDELQIRNGELLQLNNDLVNVLANITFTVVMVDRELRVRRFNPIAEKTLNLIPTDIGRHIGNLKPNILIDDLTSHLTNVIDSLAIYQAEVQDINGIWYSISIRPYKTTDNTIEGAIMILTNIDALKKAKEKSDSEVR